MTTWVKRSTANWNRYEKEVYALLVEAFGEKTANDVLPNFLPVPRKYDTSVRDYLRATFNNPEGKP